MIEYTVRVYENGRKEWYIDGKLHRTGGPAVEWADGAKEWYLNNKRHREDGPAIEYTDGGKDWFLDGERHRTDGPAIEYADGDKSWYLNDRKVTEAEHKAQTQPAKELTVAEVEKLLGYSVKIVKA